MDVVAAYYGLELVNMFLKEGYICEFDFKGTSMLPTIQHGSRIRVSPLGRIIPGLIYLIRDENPEGIVLTAHRCISVNGGGQAVFQGDNRRFPDPPVSLFDVIGEVTTWTVS